MSNQSDIFFFLNLFSFGWFVSPFYRLGFIFVAFAKLRVPDQKPSRFFFPLLLEGGSVRVFSINLID